MNRVTKKTSERKQKRVVSVLCIVCLLFFMASGCGKQKEEVCETTITNSQIIPCVQNASLTADDKAILDQRISKYTAFTLNKKELRDYIDSKGGTFQLRLKFDEELDWTIDLEYNDDHTDYTINNEEFEYNFKGRTSDNRIVRFTIDEDRFAGFIFFGEYYYYIRPAKDYTQNKEEAILILYDSRYLISKIKDYPPDFMPGSTGYYGWTCSFIEGVSRYVENDSVYVIKGIAMDTYEYGRKIKFVEDLKGNFPENVNEFMAWGDGFGVIESARIGHLANYYDKQDVLIMLLTTYDYRLAQFWKISEFESVFGVPFYEKSGDYRTIGCTYCILKLVDGYVTGFDIFPWESTIKAPWNDFYEILQESLKPTR